jgi:aspartate 1-decarboxylase
MLRKVLKAKIHRARVTGSDLNYEGSIGIDEELIEAAGLFPYECVQVWNISNGERWETYVIPSKRGSGEICLNGAAARLVQRGDPVIIASFCWMEEELIREYAGKVVLVNEQNRLLAPVV